MRILIYSPIPLFPLNNGGKNRIYHIIKNLSAKHNILFIGLNNKANNQKTIKNIKINSHYIKYLETFYHESTLDKLIYKSKKRINKYFALFPSHKKYFDQFKPDLIISAQCFSFFQCYFSRNNNIPILLDEIDISHELPYPGYFNKFLEKLSIKYSDYITCCSEKDKEKIIKLIPGAKNKFSVIKNGVDTTKVKPDLEQRTGTRNQLNINDNEFVFCFHGSLGHYPNKEALIFIKNNLKKFKIIMFGEKMPRKIDKNFISLGCVSDVNKYINACDAGIVPLSSGSGTRLKILEYLACEKPVISTPKGAEGLDIINKNNIILSNLDDFSSKMDKIIKNRNFGNKIGKNGRKLVEEKYDWKIIGNNFNDLIAKIRLGTVTKS